MVVKRGTLARNGVGASVAGIAWAMLGCAVAWLPCWITARAELEGELAKELKLETGLLLARVVLRSIGKDESIDLIGIRRLWIASQAGGRCSEGLGHRRGQLMVDMELGREEGGVVLRCLESSTPSGRIWLR